MKFSDVEIKDLLMAWILVSLAFGIYLARTRSDLFTGLWQGFWISGLTVGVAFVVHELAHKFTAQHFKKFAEFRASLPMLIAALVLSFGSILFIAPGAVIISGFVNARENGIIAAAGPLSNVVLALVLLPIFLTTQAGSLISLIVGFGFVINAWLALFNLIPFWMFDGAKIINWNKLFYGSLVAISVVMVFISNSIVAPIF